MINNASSKLCLDSCGGPLSKLESNRWLIVGVLNDLHPKWTEILLWMTEALLWMGVKSIGATTTTTRDPSDTNPVEIGRNPAPPSSKPS